VQKQEGSVDETSSWSGASTYLISTDCSTQHTTQLHLSIRIITLRHVYFVYRDHFHLAFVEIGAGGCNYKTIVVYCGSLDGFEFQGSASPHENAGYRSIPTFIMRKKSLAHIFISNHCTQKKRNRSLDVTTYLHT